MNIVRIDIATMSLSALCQLRIEKQKAIAAQQQRLAQIDAEIVARSAEWAGEPDYIIQQTQQPDSYSVNWKKFPEVMSRVPESLRPTREIWTLEKKNMPYLRDNHPDVYAVVLEAVTVTPGGKVLSVQPAHVAAAHTTIIERKKAHGN